MPSNTQPVTYTRRPLKVIWHIAAVLVAAVALLVMVLLPSIRDKRDVAFQEE